jgi:F-type H+-transporting ATPase subunit b
MATETKKSSGTAFVGIVIGAILMVGGMMAQKQLEPITKPLVEQGIPLDLGKTVATIGVFLILFPVLKTFFFQPLMDAINNRTTELEKTFTEVETLRSDMARMRSEYEKRIADTEAEAREQIQNQVKEAQTMRNQMIQEAAAAKEEMVKKAQMEIDAEKSRVLTDLRLHVVNLTMGATEKLLGENVDSERNRRLVEEFIDKIEVPS